MRASSPFGACGRRYWVRAAAVLAAGAFVIAACLYILDPGISKFWKHLIPSLVYSFVIGGWSYALFPYSWPVYRRLRAPWSWAFHLGLLLTVGVAGTLFSDLALAAIGWFGNANFWQVYVSELRIAVFFTIVTGTAITIYETMRKQLDETALELRTKELERERALKLATEARLSSLESRIHPHFLFNALNSVSALIHDDPQGAERLIEQMAALLRFSLDSDRSGLVPLEREMRIVKDYLEIERTRFGSRLRYRIDMDPGADQALIPPLSIQTLVENSVKYAVAPNRGGGEIVIRGNRAQLSLRVAVSDSGPGFDLSSVPPGHGIDILQGRLTALFGSSALLSREPGAGFSTIALTIPQDGRPG